jgi:hypothetical protein
VHIRVKPDRKRLRAKALRGAGVEPGENLNCAQPKALKARPKKYSYGAAWQFVK